MKNDSEIMNLSLTLFFS